MRIVHAAMPMALGYATDVRLKRYKRKNALIRCVFLLGVIDVESVVEVRSRCAT